jgi:hypothetical protein
MASRTRGATDDLLVSAGVHFKKDRQKYRQLTWLLTAQSCPTHYLFSLSFNQL